MGVIECEGVCILGMICSLFTCRTNSFPFFIDPGYPFEPSPGRFLLSTSDTSNLRCIVFPWGCHRLYFLIGLVALSMKIAGWEVRGCDYLGAQGEFPGVDEGDELGCLFFQILNLGGDSLHPKAN